MLLPSGMFLSLKKTPLVRPMAVLKYAVTEVKSHQLPNTLFKQILEIFNKQFYLDDFVFTDTVLFLGM